MLQVVQSTNLGARFVVELVTLASLSYWGFHVTAGAPVRTVLGLVAPLAAAVAWGLLAAPKAAITLPPGAKVAVQVAVLATAAVALVAAGKPEWAALFAVVAAVNAVLLQVWGQ